MATRSFSHAPRRGLRSVCEAAGAAALATTLVCCTHAAPSASDNPDCDAPKMAALVKNGYDDFGRGQYYRSHLAAHALIAISRSCTLLAVSAPAATHGDYLMAAISHQVGDTRQAAQYVSLGLQTLSVVKEHESESRAYANLYDQMEPRFLELQALVR